MNKDQSKQINYCRLMLGDCLEKMTFIDDCSIDMVLCDPPYGVTNCKWDSMIDLKSMWRHLKRIIKPNGVIIMTAVQPFTAALITSNTRMFRYCLVWEKSQATGHLNAWRMPMRSHEDIVVFYNKLPTYNPILTDKPKKNIRPLTSRTRHSECYRSHDLDARKCPLDKTMPKSIVKFNNAQGNVHPTQKPLPLFEYLIETYTNKSDVVLDFVMGSGTAGVACKNLDRNFIGIELDSDYFKIAEKRISEA